MLTHGAEARPETQVQSPESQVERPKSKVPGLKDRLLSGLVRAVQQPVLVGLALFVLTVGCLTVVAAWLLGRAWGGPFAGLIAGSLLATNPVHVLVNSHIAYSNCITPLFTTLGLWAV